MKLYGKKAKNIKLGVVALIGALTIGGLTGCVAKDEKPVAEQDKVVNVYSARHYDVDKAVYKTFEEETGIKVNVIEGKAPELLERLTREGEDTEADLFIAADMANVYQTIERDLVQPIESGTVDQSIPENLRGKDNDWIGLTTRARILAYDKEKVDPSELSTYEALTDAKWQGKLLVRSSDSTYNQSLVASFVEEKGEEAAKTWAEGIVANMAREPEGNDRDQVKAIAAGEGEVAILNSYYVGRMIYSEEEEERKAVEKVGIFFPEQTHINISGVVLSKYADHKENAIQLVEYMTSEKVQKMYTEQNYEYPANPNVTPHELLQSWGSFEPQDIDLTKLGEYNKKAMEIFNQVGWK